jgi:thioredoxin reductase (NADPH)
MKPFDLTKLYDVAIIGAGTAGLSAAMYSARYLLKTIVVSKDWGGLGLWAHKVDNYLGLPGITGPELMMRFKKHAAQVGAQFLLGEVLRIEKESVKGSKDLLVLHLADGSHLHGRALILAQGTRRRKLNIPGEDKYTGKGVSYCATCDGAFFKGKTVAVVGGGDAAGMATLLLSQYCPKVYLITRTSSKEGLRMEPATAKKLEEEKKIELILGNEVAEIAGEQTVKRVRLKNSYRGSDELSVEGLFIEIGGIPNSDLAYSAGVKLDEHGHVQVSDWMATNVPGIFAAGDVTEAMFKFDQFITAAAEGALAATGVYQYLKGLPIPTWTRAHEHKEPIGASRGKR